MKKLLVWRHVWTSLCGILALTGCAMMPGGTVRLDPQTPRVLNNFVTEQAALSGLRCNGTYELAVNNPREGWLFFGGDMAVGPLGSAVLALLPAGAEHAPIPVLSVKPGDPGRRETMRFLPAGDYTLRITLENAALESFTVRTIPAIIFANHPYLPHLPRFGRYDWAQLKAMGLLDVYNVIITGDDGFYAMNEWLAQGRQVLHQIPVPGINSSVPADEASVYAFWKAKRGLSDPGMSGVIADEFFGEMKSMAAYHAGIRRIRAEHPDRVFYPYIAGDPKKLWNFVGPIKDTGCRFAFERYLKERRTEAEAVATVTRDLKQAMQDFEALQPGFADKLIIVLGFLCGPNESTNANPDADFKVFMDMQVHLLATDPACAGLYGIEQYLSAYCDEEYLRWSGKLFRHYCIEGRTDRLTNDPYTLTHIRNPDFEKGLEGWTVEAAEEGSITADTLKDFGWLQGRYPHSAQGDTFAAMKRSATKPNRLIQEIRNLTPGRFYSVKMYSGEIDDLTRGDNHDVIVRVEGAQLVPEEDFQGLFHNCYSHLTEKYGSARTWFNYHRCVFKATAPTARLIISDWRSDAKPLGAVGSRTAVNFIEVEPYLMPDAFAK